MQNNNHVVIFCKSGSTRKTFVKPARHNRCIYVISMIVVVSCVYRAKATQRNLSMWLRSGVQICCSLWQHIHQCKSCSFFSDTHSEHLSADKEVEATISSWWKEIKLNPLLCVVVSCGRTRSQASSGRWALKVQKDVSSKIHYQSSS